MYVVLKILFEGWRLRWALWQLLRRSIASRTRGSVLGLGWLLLEPLFLFALYTWVFGHLLKVRFGAGEGLGAFALYLWCGLVPYNSFQQAVQGSAGVLAGNRPLLLHTKFPGWMLPLVEVLGSSVNEILGLAVLLLFVGWEQGVTPWMALIPLLVLVRLLITGGVAWFTSILAVFLPDFSQLLRMLLTLVFFATPIIYPAKLVPLEWKWLLSLNPFYWLVSGYRSVILEAAMPPPGFWWTALGGGLGSMLGVAFFNRALGRAKDFL